MPARKLTGMAVRALRAAGILPHHANRAARLLYCLAAAWVVSGSLLAPPVSYADGGEYQLMGESLLRHLSPEMHPGDVASLAERSRRQHADVRIAAALRGYSEAEDGRWYCLHFWGYSLATLPARAALRICGWDLRAPAVTNAALFLWALWQALFSSGLGRVASVGLFGLALFSPALWFVAWPHPESYCFALVLLALLWTSAGRHTRAVLAASIAAAQNPPLVWLVGPLCVRALLASWSGAPALRARRVASLAAAALPSLLPPAFYLWKFGTPSLIARDAASLELLSVQRALELLFDLNLGLWPYMPLTVPLFLLALGLRTARWQRWAWAAVLALSALSCTVTANWNHGTAGPSRYAVWLAPFVILAVAQAQAGALAQARARVARAFTLLVAAAVLTQAAIVVARGGTQQAPDYLSHSWAARLALRHVPAWYQPSPEVFISRSRGSLALGRAERAVYADERGCRKAWVRPKDARWLEQRCGSLPAREAGFLAREGGRRQWGYVNW